MTVARLVTVYLKTVVNVESGHSFVVNAGRVQIRNFTALARVVRVSSHPDPSMPEARRPVEVEFFERPRLPRDEWEYFWHGTEGKLLPRHGPYYVSPTDLRIEAVLDGSTRQRYADYVDGRTDKYWWDPETSVEVPLGTERPQYSSFPLRPVYLYKTAGIEHELPIDPEQGSAEAQPQDPPQPVGNTGPPSSDNRRSWSQRSDGSGRSRRTRPRLVGNENADRWGRAQDIPVPESPRGSLGADRALGAPCAISALNTRNDGLSTSKEFAYWQFTHPDSSWVEEAASAHRLRLLREADEREAPRREPWQKALYDAYAIWADRAHEEELLKSSQEVWHTGCQEEGLPDPQPRLPEEWLPEESATGTPQTITGNRGNPRRRKAAQARQEPLRSEAQRYLSTLTPTARRALVEELGRARRGGPRLRLDTLAPEAKRALLECRRRPRH